MNTYVISSMETPVYVWIILVVLLFLAMHFVLIKEGHLGIRTRRNKHIDVLKPGVVFKVPFIDKIKQVAMTNKFKMNEEVIKTDALGNIAISLDMELEIITLDKFENSIHIFVHRLHTVLKDKVSDIIRTIDNIETEDVKNQLEQSLIKNQDKEILNWGMRISDIDVTAVKRLDA